ncbi:MAG: FtsX-like permease family protein, partial [Bacteroidota bacterium]
PFIEGDPEHAFDDLYSIVLTEHTAVKLFGNDWESQQIIGEQMVLQRGDHKATFKVTGVMENMPDQQHFHFEYLAPIRFVETYFGEEAINNVGGNYNWLTYVRTVPGVDPEALQSRMNEEFWNKYIGTFRDGSAAKDYYDFELQPLLDIHLKSNLEGEIEVNGSEERVYIFGVIGLLLLFVACVNYMNLATSHYSRRMKEVGVRKVIGAFRSTLIKQFLTESMLVTVISFPLCVLLISWALPYLNNFVDKQMSFDLIDQYYLILPVVLLLGSVGLLAGFYPAIFLSRINLVNALKGEQSMNAGRWNFRSWLVTFQYAVTIALIFAIIVMESQMQFIRNSNPGYEREQVISVDLPRGVNYETFRNEMLSNVNIEKATLSSRIPTGRLMDSWGSRVFRGDSAVSTGFRLPYVAVDKHFLDTYEINLVAGQNFRDGMETLLSSDSTTRGYYIVNEAATKAMGYSNPEEAVNAKMAYGPIEGRIIGVMKDFHFESLHSEIVPMLLVNSDIYNQMSLKLRPGGIRETLNFIEETWSVFAPELPPSYRFVDDLFEEQYQQEKQWGIVIKVFAFIAILISCLGLVGLVGFIIETKLKEIGIRKVLGASTQSILVLVSGRFLILAGVAFVVALPVAYYFMDQWLNNFVYRTSISIVLIIMPVIISIVITFAIISYQTVMAALLNPVECLKDE